MNSSSDANQSVSSPFCLLGAAGYSRSLDTCVLEVAVILFLTTLIIAGNLVVIFVFHCAPLLHHHTTGHFIQTMAYADLLVGVSCLVPSLSLLRFLRGLNEELTCKAFGYMVSVLKSVSMASLACISVDRYIAITRPLSYATLVTPCRLRACIVLVWAYSALVFLPSFLGWGKPGYHGDTFRWCAESWTTSPGFSAFIVALLYAPAALTVCFTYGSIFRICRQHTREITRRHARFSSQAEGASSTCCGCVHPILSPGERRAVPPQGGVFFTTWLGDQANSFCNCLIYSLSNSVFRKGLGRLFPPAAARLPRLHGRQKGPEPRRPA
uniref:G protein-coupled receptor 21 n=1 Tax=Cyclopterus lumpus TaxID=8103 RepID=A0A8C2Z2V9_CYCLU